MVSALAVTRSIHILEEWLTIHAILVTAAAASTGTGALVTLSHAHA